MKETGKEFIEESVQEGDGISSSISSFFTKFHPSFLPSIPTSFSGIFHSFIVCFQLIPQVFSQVLLKLLTELILLTNSSFLILSQFSIVLSNSISRDWWFFFWVQNIFNTIFDNFLVKFVCWSCFKLSAISVNYFIHWD